MQWPTFDELMRRWSWTPIPHCAGRYRLAGPPRDISPEGIAGPDIESREFEVPTAHDRVVVTLLAGGGLISYRRPDGRYVHTLNDSEGLSRKLAALGIDLPDRL